MANTGIRGLGKIDRWLLAALISVAAIAPSCGEDPPEGLRRTAITGGPKVKYDLSHRPLPEVPLPIDIATRIDETSPTGRRLNVGLQAKTRWESHLREAFDELDGFGVYAPISVGFDAPIDPLALRARHANDDFRDDAIYLLNVDPKCERYGEEVALDVGRGRFPVIMTEHGKPGNASINDGNRIFEFDPASTYNNLFFEERNEDKNGNGILDPGEDLDDDGVLDVANLDDPKACDGLADGSIERDRCIADHLMTFYERESNTVIVRPVWPLEEQCTYAVVLTNRLTDPQGRAVQSPFAYVNHREQTTALKPVPGLLSRYGLGLDDIAFAWTFTTGTMTKALVALRDGLHGQGPWARLATEFPVESLEMVDMTGGKKVADAACSAQAITYYWWKGIKEYSPNMCAFAAENASVGGLVYGKFDMPNFLVNKNGWTNDVHRNDEEERFDIDWQRGTGTYGRDQVTFWCALPKKRDTSCSPGNPEGKPFCQPYPTALYGQGYGSSRAEITSWLGRQAAMGVASCAIDTIHHGANVLKQFATLGAGELQKFKIPNFTDVLLEGRDRDINDDGRPDPGRDMYVSDLAHTRDNLRQSVLEFAQAVRILRSMDGVRRAKDGSVFGDFDGDGTPDIGGDKGTISVWGISLGGLITGVTAGLEPDVDTTIPMAGAAGLSDVTARATVSGLPAAVFLPVLGPFVAGYKTKDNGEAYPDGETELGFLVGDLNDRARVDFARIRGLAPGDKIEVYNVEKQSSSTATVTANGTFRVPFAADALTTLKRREALGYLDKEPNAPYEITDTPRFGDRLIIRFRDANGAPKPVTSVDEGDTVTEIATFKHVAEFQVLRYTQGAPLVSPVRGLGYRRNTPNFRRFFSLAQHALDSVDTAVWSQYWFEKPRPGVRLSQPGRENHVLVIPTAGDTVVPVNTAIASARTAGLLGSWRRDEKVAPEHGWRKLFVPDPRYGKSIDQWLLDTKVIENQPRFGRNASNPKNPRVLFDVDDLSEGRVKFDCGDAPCDPGFAREEVFGIPAPPPDKRLRATHVRADGSMDAMRIPLLDPEARHGIWNGQKRRIWDADSHTTNFVTLYMISRGKQVDLDPECACLAATVPTFFLDGQPIEFSDEAPCVNTPGDVKIRVCSESCTQKLGLFTEPEVRCQ
jgi:hypothetical protein